MYRSINPASEELIAEYQLDSNVDLDRAIIQATKTQQAWSKQSLPYRLERLNKFKELLLMHEAELACLISSEMGKLYASAKQEILSGIRMVDFLLANAEIILQREQRALPVGQVGYVDHCPFGVIFSITPWNYPCWLPLRSSLPALIAGNAVLLKPAPNVVGVAKYLVELFRLADFPMGIFQLLLIDNSMAEKLIAHRSIAKVSFTGSVATGQHLAEIAGRNIKPMVLELGGSDAFIALPSADLKLAAKQAAAARCRNAGQVCCSSKRFLVHQEIYSEFVQLFKAELSNLEPGDPFDPSSGYGPQARADLLTNLESQIELACKAGAEVLLAGGKKAGQGYYFSPVLLAGITAENPICNQEVFGPVAMIQEYSTLDQALEIANNNRFGLAASIFGTDQQELDFLIAGLQVGTIAINKTVSGDPFLPFGGFKDSGWGRESGKEGLLEYTQTKVIVVEQDRHAENP